MRWRTASGTAAAACAGLLLWTTAACTDEPDLADCAAPLLVTVSGDAWSGDTAIELWHPDGRTEVLDPDPDAYQPTISPDGRTVAFALGEGLWSDSTGYDTSRVAVLSVETRVMTVLSTQLEGTSVYQLEWSSDGAEIAFLRRGLDVHEVVAVAVDDGAERRLLDVSASSSRDFAWSPDRRELLVPAYPSAPAGVGEREHDELRRYTIATGDYSVVPTPHTVIDEVSWSHDGRWVAMEADIPGTYRTRLYALDLEAGTSVAVDRRRGGPRSMTWSGPYLVYTYDVSKPEPARLLMSWDSRSDQRMDTERPGAGRFLSYEATISAPRCLQGS